MRRKRRIPHNLLLILLTVILSGCTSIDYHDHPTLHPNFERSLHELEPFNPDKAGERLKPDPEIDEKAQLERVMSDPPIKKTLRFSLAEVRRSTLHNNLDLTAAFFDPSIAATRVYVEQGKFEATFNLTASQSKTVGPQYTPDTTNLTDTTHLQTAIEPTLNVPLITGGAVTLGPLFASSDYNAPGVGENEYWQSSAQLDLAQPLLRNAGTAYNQGPILLAMYQERIEAARTKLSVINTLLRAEVAYWNVYLAWRLLEIQRQQYGLYRKELNDTQKLEKSGVRTMADVYGFETGLAMQVSLVLQANNDLRQAIRELKVLMHDPSLSLDDTVGVEPSTKPLLVHYQFDPQTIVQAALKNRMELLEMELQLAADALNIRLAKNQALPQLDVDLSIIWNGFSPTGYGNATDRLLRGSDDTGWNVGLVTSVPLGNKVASAQLRGAVLKRLQDIATKNQRKTTIVKEAYDAIDALNTAWLDLVAARYRVQAAKNSFIAEKKLFSLGDRTSTDVSNALLELGIARVAEANAEITYQISLAQLAAATGSLLGYSKVEWISGDESTVIPPAFGGKNMQ
jgi:outer membrane protein